MRTPASVRSVRRGNLDHLPRTVRHPAPAHHVVTEVALVGRGDRIVEPAARHAAEFEAADKAYLAGPAGGGTRPSFDRPARRALVKQGRGGVHVVEVGLRQSAVSLAAEKRVRGSDCKSAAERCGHYRKGRSKSSQSAASIEEHWISVPKKQRNCRLVADKARAGQACKHQSTAG